MSSSDGEDSSDFGAVRIGRNFDQFVIKFIELVPVFLLITGWPSTLVMAATQTQPVPTLRLNYINNRRCC